MNTKIVQKCGCYEGDCVEILGLEVPLYACFTCGYAGVTPSGADNPHENEVHVHDLLAEVERLRRLNNYLWEHRSSHWSADDDAEMDRLGMIE
tara:strand:- start:274 stop:552 length:279 start_codon:yes stop_codon:yes gene_type:complete